MDAINNSQFSDVSWVQPTHFFHRQAIENAMKRKRSSTSPATRSVQTSHKECTLLQLPSELRIRILQHLLYSPEPLGKKSDGNHKHISERHFKKTFTFHPAILRVCRQVHEEGCDILYCRNIAKANTTLCFNDEHSIVEYCDNIIPRHDLGVHRFLNWDVTVKLNLEFPKDVLDTIVRFTSDILRVVSRLNRLKVRLELWDNEDLHYPESNISFADSHDFDDMAEQIFRPFSIIRVR